MKITDLFETIPNKPRNLKLFIQNALSVVSKLVIAQGQIKQIVEENEREGDSMLHYFLRYGTDDSKNVDGIYGLLSLAKYCESRFPLENLKHNLQSYLTYGAEFRQYVLSTFKYIDPIPQEYKDVFPSLATAEQGAAKYGFASNDTDPEYIAAMKLLAAMRMLEVIITNGEAIWKNIYEKLTIVGQINDRYRPGHEDVEPLYHGTAFCTEILEHGFQAEKPDGRRGLGNYGNQKTISFTHDLEIARNLMRALKEVWMIAHGQLTARQIIGWAKSEGISNDVAHSFKMLSGETLLDTISIEKTVILYRVWLALTKIRVDPVFTYPEETLAMMKNRKLEDIGVLACEVKLTSNDEYMVGEAEFRIPASQVLNIKKIL